VKIDTLARSLVDTKPIYEALAEIKDQSGIYTAATRKYLRTRLKATIREMRSVAKHVDDELKGLKE
jgi:hypothetical protein